MSDSLLPLLIGIPVSVAGLNPAVSLAHPFRFASSTTSLPSKHLAQTNAAGATQQINLSPAQASAAATILLEALATGDANKIHQGLSDPLRSSTTPENIEAKLKSRPEIRSGRIVEITPGHDDTTVNAIVMTSKGEAPIMLVLDEQGKLLAWKWTGEILPLEQTAIDFVNDLSNGRWVSARSRMALDFQKEFAPQDLERKWKKLVRVSGGFEKVKDAIVANQGGSQQLVLVTVQFGNVTDNLFVIFDEKGKVINVDIGKDFV